MMNKDKPLLDELDLIQDMLENVYEHHLIQESEGCCADIKSMYLKLNDIKHTIVQNYLTNDKN